MLSELRRAGGLPCRRQASAMAAAGSSHSQLLPPGTDPQLGAVLLLWSQQPLQTPSRYLAEKARGGAAWCCKEGKKPNVPLRISASGQCCQR